MDDNSTLAVNEPHPAARNAQIWLSKYLSQNPKRLMILEESLASTALAGNRMAEVCLGTLKRLLSSQPVSDRYVLGLAWFIKEVLIITEEKIKEVPPPPPNTGSIVKKGI